MSIPFKIQPKSISKLRPSSARLPPTTTFASLLVPTYFPALLQLPRKKEDRFGKQAAARSRVREGLWWVVVASPAVSPKRVVRSWTKRRVVHAFEAALAMEGYTSTGILLESAGNASHIGMQGTLRLAVAQAAITAPITLIREETLAIVKALRMEVVRRREDGTVASARDKFRKLATT